MKPLNLVVFADTDLLADYLWVHEQNFFGQRLTQAWASNGDLVLNALDNLAGSADLISVRGRATFTRPFERVEKLRRAADDRFRDKEQELEQQLQATEQKLDALQSVQGRRTPQRSIITPRAGAGDRALRARRSSASARSCARCAPGSMRRSTASATSSRSQHHRDAGGVRAAGACPRGLARARAAHAAPGCAMSAAPCGGVAGRGAGAHRVRDLAVLAASPRARRSGRATWCCPGSSRWSTR